MKPSKLRENNSNSNKHRNTRSEFCSSSSKICAKQCGVRCPVELFRLLMGGRATVNERVPNKTRPVQKPLKAHISTKSLGTSSGTACVTSKNSQCQVQCQHWEISKKFFSIPRDVFLSGISLSIFFKATAAETKSWLGQRDGQLGLDLEEASC